MKRWTPEEIEILKLDVSLDEMLIFLPGRSREGIAKKRNALGNGIKNVNVWTDKEIEIISRDITIKEMKELLPHRSIRSIQGKRSILKINPLSVDRKSWSEEDIKLLRETYPMEDKEEVMRVLGRNWPAIKSKASNLKIKRYR